MRSIANIFGRSPFGPLQDHMEKVAECVRGVPEVLAAYEAGDEALVAELAKSISKREHEADLVKDDLRDNLPRSLFMPVDRANLLRVLSIQDNLADKAENIAILLTFHMVDFSKFKELFDPFLALNLDTFEAAYKVIQELDELLESGFGGPEAAKVTEMVSVVAKKEHQTDRLQRELLRALFKRQDELTHGDFYLWMQLVHQVAGLSNSSENLANTIRSTLENK